MCMFWFLQLDLGKGEWIFQIFQIIFELNFKTKNVDQVLIENISNKNRVLEPDEACKEDNHCQRRVILHILVFFWFGVA